MSIYDKIEELKREIRLEAPSKDIFLDSEEAYEYLNFLLEKLKSLYIRIGKVGDYWRFYSELTDSELSEVCIFVNDTFWMESVGDNDPEVGPAGVCGYGANLVAPIGINTKPPYDYSRPSYSVKSIDWDYYYSMRKQEINKIWKDMGYDPEDESEEEDEEDYESMRQSEELEYAFHSRVYWDETSWIRSNSDVLVFSSIEEAATYLKTQFDEWYSQHQDLYDGAGFGYLPFGKIRRVREARR